MDENFEEYREQYEAVRDSPWIKPWTEEVARSLDAEVDETERALEVLRDEFDLVTNWMEDEFQVWAAYETLEANEKLQTWREIRSNLPETREFIHEYGFVTDMDACIRAALDAIEELGCPVCGDEPELSTPQTDLIWLSPCGHTPGYQWTHKTKMEHETASSKIAES